MQANEMRSQFLLRYEGAQLANRTFNDREISSLLTMAMNEIVKRRFAPDKNVKRKGFESDIIRSAELSGLITAHTVFTKAGDDFMIGTESNGALRTPDLDTQSTSGSVSVTTDFGVFCRIPDEAMYIILQTCSVNKGTCTVDNVEVQDVTYLDYADGITNYYKRPYKNLVWGMNWGSFTTSGSNSIENSTKFGDTAVDPAAVNNDDISGFKGKSYDDGTTDVWIQTLRSKMLIPGKDWLITKYNIYYVKSPSDIVVDVQTPTNQIPCELADFMHDEIVDYAVKLAAASIIPEPNKYQVAQVESTEDE